jgi:DNA-binding protein Fis
LDKIVKADIDEYENPMIRNIYSYCTNNQFSSAVFMCGAAHRKSIIEKIQKFKTEEQVYLIWTVFEN